MIKSSCNFLSRLSRHSVPGTVSLEEASQLSWFRFRNGFSTWGHNPGGEDISVSRTFADFSIFKGKAALIVSPVLPKFSMMDSGNSVVKKKGSVLLKFMPAVGTRKYDPEKRQLFALSPTEVGCLISLGPEESCEFFHDPSMKSSQEGEVKKSLTVSPTSNDGGYFFTLNVSRTAQKSVERFTLPVTKAEFSVLRTSFSVSDANFSHSLALASASASASALALGERRLGVILIER